MMNQAKTIIWDTITQHFMHLCPMYEMHHSKGSYVFFLFFFRWMFQPANMLDILRWPTSLGETHLDYARRVWAANLCGAKSRRSMVNRRLPPISQSLPKIGKLGRWSWASHKSCESRWRNRNPQEAAIWIRGHDKPRHAWECSCAIDPFQVVYLNQRKGKHILGKGCIVAFHGNGCFWATQWIAFFQ